MKLHPVQVTGSSFQHLTRNVELYGVVSQLIHLWRYDGDDNNEAVAAHNRSIIIEFKSVLCNKNYTVLSDNDYLYLHNQIISIGGKKPTQFAAPLNVLLLFKEYEDAWLDSRKTMSFERWFLSHYCVSRLWQLYEMCNNLKRDFGHLMRLFKRWILQNDPSCIQTVVAGLTLVSFTEQKVAILASYL